ncbi:RDD family protein [Natronobacterium texcoconense]|uniref:Uncharacterized membrane protein YckC, RDD family n=1 Tax=Natronobacterium texcoconense TaxID=1095778 RepID=A0A1H1F6C7_NATTX|nr:RDD family protein [Natronobacterium texcoconense]SDQ96427.1 Uncharacterized membrane protein YckC, RDD family [Natronobacterium texcoconense]
MVGPQRSRLRHAGLLERGAAWFVDGIASFIAIFVLMFPIIFLFSAGGSADAAEGMGMLVGLVGLIAYYVGSEAKWGQTPGKMLLGIRVVYTDGRECSGAGAVIRNITKLIGGAALLPIIVAIVLILVTDDNQRLGDIFGDTTVVKV